MLLYQWTIETEDGPVYVAAIAESEQAAKDYIFAECAEDFENLPIQQEFTQLDPVIEIVADGLVIVAP